MPDDTGNQESDLASPLGKGAYTVQPGDCVSSVAFAHGFFEDTLWDLPENADVKKARKDLNILLPGDRLTIPELRSKTLDCAIDQSHTFRRIGVPERLRIQMLDGDQKPRKNLEYTLTVDESKFTGKTDGDGYLDHWISPAAMSARLEFPKNEFGLPEAYDIDIGRLDPVNSVNGAAARMQNLGFFGPGQPFQRALEDFQEIQKLEVTGALDRATQDKLVELYGY